MLRHIPVTPHASVGADPGPSKPVSPAKVAFLALGGAGLYLLVKGSPLAGIGLMGLGLFGGGLYEQVTRSE